MRNALVRPTTIPLLVLCFHLALATAAGAAREVVADGATDPLGEHRHSMGSKQVALGKAAVATWTFDDASGQPDPQGWTAVDRTAQSGTYFQIEDFAGLGGGVGTGLSPLSGARSLWIGARPCASAELCSYASLPGYGNNWHQRFESVPFVVSGGVSISFDIRYDTDHGADAIFFEYRAESETWLTLLEFTGSGEETIDSYYFDPFATPAQFRFRFQSDDDGSDEDGDFDSSGAAIIDNLVISDATGIVDFQDFEGEATGALVTSDGDWAASSMPAFGLHADLFDGATVLQEDPLVTNTTNVWGFFAGSPDRICGSLSEQPVVPLARYEDGTLLYFWNEIRSPAVPIPGLAGQPLALEFDVYRDLPRALQVYYRFHIRSLVDGIWGEWRSNGFIYRSLTKEWYSHSFDVQALVEPGATDVQIAIGVQDWCPTFCGPEGVGCHTHAPLIDNVRLTSNLDEYVVTNTSDSGAGSLRAAITEVNANPSGGAILFDIAGAGTHTIQCTSTLPSIVRSVVVDGRTQPGYVGSPLVEVAGRFNAPLLDLTATNSAVFGLGLRRSGDGGQGSSSVGIRLASSGGIVQGCAFSNFRTASEVFGSDNLVGGVDSGEGNVFNGATRTAVYVGDGAQGNRILGNSIYDVQEMGIDLHPIGPSANDANDADGGANRGQNHPTLFSAQSKAVSTRIVGELASMAAQTYRIEFFSTSACGASGRGLGQVYLGSVDVVTQGTIGMGGTGLFDVELPVTVASGSSISATATDPAGNTSEISPCVVAVNTPAGAAVVVQPIDTTSGSLPVTLAFDQVLVGGETSLTITDVNPVQSFVSSDGLFYDISTTAQFTGEVEVCLTYDEALLLVPENRLLLFHWDTESIPPVWTEITSTLDTGTNTICGTTDHFSPFALGVDTVTDVESAPTLRTVVLRQNVPNPFNPFTTISFDVLRDGDAVQLRVFDVAGRLVRVLAEGERAAGTHVVSWDGRDFDGRTVSTGVYYYRLSTGSVELTRRMMLLK